MTLPLVGKYFSRSCGPSKSDNDLSHGVDVSRGLEEVSDFCQKLQRCLRGAKCTLRPSDLLVKKDGGADVFDVLNSVREPYVLPCIVDGFGFGGGEDS